MHKDAEDQGLETITRRHYFRLKLRNKSLLSAYLISFKRHDFCSDEYYKKMKVFNTKCPKYNRLLNRFVLSDNISLEDIAHERRRINRAKRLKMKRLNRCSKNNCDTLSGNCPFGDDAKLLFSIKEP